MVLGVWCCLCQVNQPTCHDLSDFSLPGWHRCFISISHLSQWFLVLLQEVVVDVSGLEVGIK